MGKIIQIRVMAATPNADQVEKSWPALVRVAKAEGKGALELVDALNDQLRFGDVADTVKEIIGDDGATAAHLKMQLEKALADWDPETADSLSYKLEDLLGEIEDRLPKD